MSRITRAKELQKSTNSVLNQLAKVEREGDELIVLEQVALYLGYRLVCYGEEENEPVERSTAQRVRESIPNGL